MSFRETMWTRVAAIALSLTLCWSAPAAKASHVSCNETIAADTTLDSDLTKCSGPGIRIGADNITLDLNGHTIAGKGKGVGVNNMAGHDGVTIEGGTVRNFMESVAMAGASDTDVRGLSVSKHRHVGILVLRSTAIHVENSSVTDTRFGGIVVSDSHDVEVEGNSSSGNGAGIALIDGTSESQVEANTLSNNDFGVLLQDADANQVSGNEVSYNVDNIIVFGNANTVTDNQVTDAVGCKKGCGYGIALAGGGGNLIAGNEVSRTLLDGIRIDAFDPERETPTLDNVVRDNLVADASVDGISIGTEGDGTVSGTLIEGNVATRSGDDGFDIRRPAATLTANIANDNFDLGFEAVLGVIDGGGNTASGNGNPLQCTNVFCG